MTPQRYTVLIVDDERPARERLARLLEELPSWEVVGSCATGAEALELAQRLEPVAVLLDIRMPGISGLETAQHLAVLDTPPAVVFTTAYDEYAMAAFDAQAVGYLLKPVRVERLRKALDHAARLSAAQLRQIAKADQEYAARRHIATRIGEQLRLVPISEVILFRADQKYVSVIHRNGEHLIDESLKDLAEEFSAQFVRIHRSILINAAQLESLDKDSQGKYMIHLRGYHEPLPVSRRQVSDVKRFIRGDDGKNLD